MASNRDPFDRLISAQASVANATLVTADAGIRKHYSRAQLVQVCAGLDTAEAVSREYHALHKGAATTRCRDLLIITHNGALPPRLLVPRGAAVAVKAAREWLLEG